MTKGQGFYIYIYLFIFQCVKKDPNWTTIQGKSCIVGYTQRVVVVVQHSNIFANPQRVVVVVQHNNME